MRAVVSLGTVWVSCKFGVVGDAVSLREVQGGVDVARHGVQAVSGSARCVPPASPWPPACSAASTTRWVDAVGAGGGTHSRGKL